MKNCATWSCEWLFWFGWAICSALIVRGAVVDWSDPASPILLASIVLAGLVIRFCGWVGLFDYADDEDCGIRKDGQGRG